MEKFYCWASCRDAYYSYAHAGDLQKLGFPDYFRIERVVAKVAGALVLIMPFISLRMSEWVLTSLNTSHDVISPAQVQNLLKINYLQIDSRAPMARPAVYSCLNLNPRRALTAK